ncbi:MAG: hypothetical protein HRF45_09565 [Fimbriimonadia bacterium]
MRSDYPSYAVLAVTAPTACLLFTLLMAGCGGTGTLGGSPPLDPEKLNAVFVSRAPTLDGDPSDPEWAGAPKLTFATGEGMDTSLASFPCTTCHAQSGPITVSMRAVYTSDHIYFLVRWPDSTASLTRRDAWTYLFGNWVKLSSGQSEDRVSLFFPIGQIRGDDFNTGGCMTKCHVTDNHNSGACGQECHAPVRTRGVAGWRDEVYLVEGMADLWHSKAARGMAALGASSVNAMVDEDTNEMISGTLSLTGYCDDEYITQYTDEELGGRLPDAGEGADVLNATASKSAPLFMEKNPTDYADAMVLTQAEIDAGECYGHPVTGVTKAEANEAWPKYKALGAVVPERILRAPTGSCADVRMSATWRDGWWTAELSRALDTGRSDDVRFVPGQGYVFGLAIMDNSGGGRHFPARKRILMLYR